MATVVSSFVTIGCDAAECGKTVTFPQTPEAEKEAIQDNPWLNCMRFVQTIKGEKFGYCSDECEIKGAATGNHNQKKIVTEGVSPAQATLLAQAQERARQATEAMKSGHGQIQVTG
jgi:hypothetical protein